MQGYQFTDENGSFQLEGAENDLGLYFPIAGEHGLKSAITPNLAGDAKLDQNHFLLEPTSIGDLVDSRSKWKRVICGIRFRVVQKNIRCIPRLLRLSPFRIM